MSIHVLTFCDEWVLTVHVKMLNVLELSVGMDFHLVLQKSKKEKRSSISYPTSTVFSLTWLLAFTKSSAWLVCRVVG